jgi:predicted NAD/FAD-binding protein
MSKTELKTVRSLGLNKDIRTLLADKSNGTVVLEESEYKDKLNILLHFGVYEHLPEDPTARVERKLQKLISKHKTAFPAELKRKLTPYHTRPPTSTWSSQGKKKKKN